MQLVNSLCPHAFCLVWRAAAAEKAATLTEYSPKALMGKIVFSLTALASLIEVPQSCQGAERTHGRK